MQIRYIPDLLIIFLIVGLIVKWSYEKIKLKYQEMQQRTFMIGGKALSLEDIDSLNADQKKEILKKLEKRKN